MIKFHFIFNFQYSKQQNVCCIVRLKHAGHTYLKFEEIDQYSVSELWNLLSWTKPSVKSNVSIVCLFRLCLVEILSITSQPITADGHLKIWDMTTSSHRCSDSTLLLPMATMRSEKHTRWFFYSCGDTDIYLKLHLLNVYM